MEDNAFEQNLVCWASVFKYSLRFEKEKKKQQQHRDKEKKNNNNIGIS